MKEQASTDSLGKIPLAGLRSKKRKVKKVGKDKRMNKALKLIDVVEGKDFEHSIHVEADEEGYVSGSKTVKVGKKFKYAFLNSDADQDGYTADITLSDDSEAEDYDQTSDPQMRGNTLSAETDVSTTRIELPDKVVKTVKITLASEEHASFEFTF